MSVNSYATMLHGGYHNGTPCLWPPACLYCQMGDKCWIIHWLQSWFWCLSVWHVSELNMCMVCNV